MWIMRFHTKATASVNLICLPHAGGGASSYKEWSSKLPDTIELSAAQLPGRENRIIETPCSSIEEIVDGLLKAIQPQLDRPYMLFGHSMGAKIGFELIHSIMRLNWPLPKHFFVSGAPAPQLPRRKEPISHLPHSEFMQKLSEYDGTPQEIFESEELQELFLPTLRADFKIVEDYQCAENRAAISINTSVYAGKDDTHVELEDVAQWSKVTKVVKNRTLSGGHFFLKDHLDLLLQDIQLVSRTNLARM